LTYIYKLKKARQNEANHGFDHAIIVDEAHNIFLKKPTNFSNESVTDMIYREMREYGTSLICLDQHISKISDTVKGNSACHIAFQQQLPQDIHDISELMQLHEKRHYFSELPVGSAIVKLSERYTIPFLIEVPYAVIRDTNVTDEDVKGRMKAMMLNDDYEKNVDPEFNAQIENPASVKQEPKKTLSVQQILFDFVQEYLHAGVALEDIEKILEQNKDRGRYASSDIIQVINKVFDSQLNQKKEVLVAPEISVEKKIIEPTENKTQPKKSVVISTTNDLSLTADEKNFIDFLFANPNHELSTVQVYQKIGLGARKGTSVKKGLEDKKIIKIQEVKYDKGWKKFIRLRDSFIETNKKNGI
jgi:DNA-binding transcriptional MerR regulator